MTINWKALALRLSRPWWGLVRPEHCTMVNPGFGGRAGIGLVIEQDYGTWNLTLLAQGTYALPTTLAEHQTMIELFVRTKPVSAYLVHGQPLGSYATLMTPDQFAAWIGSLSVATMSKPMRSTLLHGLTRLKATALP